MSSPNSASGSGGFLGCFCRPKHVEDTGVAHASSSNGSGSRSIPHGGSERSRVVATASQSSLPPRHSSTRTNGSTGSSKQQIIRPNKHSVNNADIPLIPSPPSDDATPLMSNRKVGGGTSGNSSSSSRTMPPSLLTQPKTSSKQNTMNIREGTKIMIVKKPETARPPPSAASQAPTLTDTVTAAEHPSMIPPEDNDGMDAVEGTPNSSQQQSQRKAVSYYPNHVQDNVKVMREYYEQQAFLSSGSRSSYEGDATETTVEDEDLTESSAAPEDWRSNSSSRQPHSLRVDCHEDPYESAYAVWYHKGLLKWRPKSVTHAESSSAVAVSFPDHSNATTTTTTAVNQKDNQGDNAMVATTAPDQTNDTNQNKNDDDTATSQRSLLEKFRSTTTKTTTHTCTNCQKDLSSLKTISVVKCMQCNQELYCSVFCRGNDRYSHSTVCPAQQPTASRSPEETWTTNTVTTPPSRRNVPTPGSSSSVVVVLDESASASRTNSYKKSRQVPMVSLFGHHSTATTTTTDTTLSARRLTTEFRA